MPPVFLRVHVRHRPFHIFITGRSIRKIGVGWTLVLIPMLLVIGFLALGAAPVLGVMVMVQVLRRAGTTGS